jgi:hypothetical protein
LLKEKTAKVMNDMSVSPVLSIEEEKSDESDESENIKAQKLAAS